MTYDARTQDDLTSWWITGTGSVVNRLSEVMDDMLLGPAIYYTTGWTAAGSEYWREQIYNNDATQEKIGAAAWSALVLGAGVGVLNAGEYFYDVGTSRLYVRLTGDVVPNATNQTRAHYSWNGGLSGVDFMTELAEDRLYKVHLTFNIGDDSTSTAIESLNEFVYFDDGQYAQILNNATLSLGELIEGGVINGACWLFNVSASFNLSDGNENTYFNFYDSKIIALPIVSGTLVVSLYYANADIRKSSLSGGYNLGVGNLSFALQPSLYSLNINDFYISSVRNTFFFAATNVSVDKLKIHYSYNGITINSLNPVVNITNLDLNYYLSAQINTGVTQAGEVNIINPASNLVLVAIGNANCKIKEQYTVNINVADNNGAALSGVIINCYDQSGTACWTEGTVTTDANGDITEQIATYKQWAGTSETLTTYSPHIFTFYKPGYIVSSDANYNNITINKPIDWHIEMHPARSIR